MLSRSWMPVRPAVALLAFLALTGCSSFLTPFDAGPATGTPAAAPIPASTAASQPATMAPTTGPDAPRPTPGQQPAPPPREEFRWGLPDGPNTPNDTYEDDFYALLEEGRCGVMAEALLGRAQVEGLTGPISWYSLDSPRTVLLYYVAANICAKQLDEARRVDGWAARYGWRGIKWDQNEADGQPATFFWDCEVFKSVRSVLDQVDRSSVTCEGGTPPRWPDPDAKDNPLTSKVESIDRFGEPTQSSPSPNQSAGPNPSATPSAAG